MKKHIPNLLTLSRIVLAPVLLVYLQQQSLAILLCCLPTMIYCELSDAFDGYLARKWQVQKGWGKILDPFADSVYHFFVFLAFLANHWLPAWMLAIVFFRDISVAYLRIIMADSGVIMGARISGKAKAISQGLAQIFALLIVVLAMGLDLSFLTEWLWYIFLLTVLITLYSGLDYTFGVCRHLKAKSPV